MKSSIRAFPPTLLQRIVGEPLADAELIARFVRARDEAAFTALVERHGSMVMGVCWRVLGDGHAAEDAFQGAFLALAQSAGRLRDPAAVATWLYGAAVRIALKTRRRTARSRATERRVSIRPCSDPLDEISARELVGAIDEELARLPEGYRVAVVLCCLEGLSQGEAARRLGWSAGSLKGRLERGRERLRERLAKRGIVLSAGLVGILLGPARATVPPSLIVRTTALVAPGAALPAVAKLAAGVLPSRAWWLAAVALAVLAAGTLAVTGRGTPALTDPPAQAPVPHPNDPITANRSTDRFGDPLPDGAVLRLGTIRLRQEQATAVAFDPDGALVSVGTDHIVRVWDRATGRLLRSREFEKDLLAPQRGPWLSADAQRLALQYDRRVKVFDTASGRELASVVLPSIFQVVARFSPDGKQLAVVDENGKVQVCDIGAKTARELAKIGTSSSLELAFSRDGRRLALANFQAGAVVWNLDTDRELTRFQPADLAVAVDFDPTGNVLAVLSTGPKQSVHFVDVATGRAAEKWIAPPADGRNWVRFNPDGTRLLLSDPNGITWWDPKAGKVVRSCTGPAVLRPAFTADGALVASGGPNALQIWSTKTGRWAGAPTLGAAPTGEVRWVSVSPDAKWFITCDVERDTIRIWDSTGAQTGLIRSKQYCHTAFSPDGKHLYGTAPDAVALVRWNLPERTESARYVLAEPTSDHETVSNAALSSDGLRLAAVTVTNTSPEPGAVAFTLTVWDTATGRRLVSRKAIADLDSWFAYGAFAPDLRWYAFQDRVLSLDGGPDLRLDMPKGWGVRKTVTSPDGRFLAQAVYEYGQTVMKGRTIVGQQPRGVVIRELATGKQVFTLPTGPCGPLAFTADGRALIVTGPDGISRWDIVAKKVVVRHAPPDRFTGHYGESFASSLAVTPDGTQAVTGHIDTTALVWDLKPPPRRPRALSEQEMIAAWEDLARSDTDKAHAAAWALADTGNDAVAFLRTRLRPVVLPEENQVRKLVARLGADEFAEREAAQRELNALGDVTVPALRAALKGDVKAEQAQRIGKVLTAAGAPALPPGDRLRAVRAVAVLERVATKDARELLERLTGGAEESSVTRAAKAAALRLRQPVR